MSTLFENQFVPIHTISSSHDFILKMTANCPTYQKLLDQELNSNSMQDYLTQSLSFFKQLEKETG